MAHYTKVTSCLIYNPLRHFIIRANSNISTLMLEIYLHAVTDNFTPFFLILKTIITYLWKLYKVTGAFCKYM